MIARPPSSLSGPPSPVFDPPSHFFIVTPLDTCSLLPQPLHDGKIRLESNPMMSVT
jgi:hypothetical protein